MLTKHSLLNLLQKKAPFFLPDTGNYVHRSISVACPRRLLSAQRAYLDCYNVLKFKTKLNNVMDLHNVMGNSWLTDEFNSDPLHSWLICPSSCKCLPREKYLDRTWWSWVETEVVGSDLVPWGVVLRSTLPGLSRTAPETTRQLWWDKEITHKTFYKCKNDPQKIEEKKSVLNKA